MILPDLLIPADDGIEGAVPGQFVEIAGVPLQRLILLFGIGIGDPLISPDLDEDLEDRILRNPRGVENLRRRAVLLVRCGYENMLRTDILIRQARRLAQGRVQDLVEPRGHIGLSAGHALHLRQPLQGLLYLAFDAPGIGAELLDDFGGDSLRLFQQGDEKMLDVKGLVPVLGGQPLRLLDRLLHLQGEFIESHRNPLHMTIIAF